MDLIIGEMSKFNDFNINLQYSIDNNDDKILSDLYYRVFPLLKSIEIVSDIELQKKGIDKILHFFNGKKLFIDEKKRRKNYNDILIEEYSVFENKTWGWLNRGMITDYIVYIIMDVKIAYFLPFQLLQKAWLRNYTQWLNEYGRIFAQNKNYRTSNIPIPTNVLLDSIKHEITENIT